MARWLALVLLAALACEKKQERAPERKQPERRAECTSASDCSDDDPCTAEECRDARCVVVWVPAGTSCDNDTVCDGVASCDARGRCVAGPPPHVDDGNACTLDSCDSKRGAVHEPVDVDDDDACTRDSCNPKTGAISHEPIDVDDDDDCTEDSCDRTTGPKHEPPPTKYACGACPEGFHAVSRMRSAQCEAGKGVQSFCAKDCGKHFYTCEASCPSGWSEKSRAPNKQCGPGSEMLFCMR